MYYYFGFIAYFRYADEEKLFFRMVHAPHQYTLQVKYTDDTCCCVCVTDRRFIPPRAIFRSPDIANHTKNVVLLKAM